jgi:hypothetical protein
VVTRVHGGAGRELLRLLVIAAFVVGLLGSAAVGTWRVVDEVRDPGRACVQQLPPFEGLQIISTRREWSPPIVRCKYFAALVDQLGTARTVSAVTAKNLIVVGGLDVLVVALVVARANARRRRRAA